MLNRSIDQLHMVKMHHTVKLHHMARIHLTIQHLIQIIMEQEEVLLTHKDSKVLHQQVKNLRMIPIAASRISETKEIWNLERKIRNMEVQLEKALIVVQVVQILMVTKIHGVKVKMILSRNFSVHLTFRNKIQLGNHSHPQMMWFNQKATLQRTNRQAKTHN